MAQKYAAPTGELMEQVNDEAGEFIDALRTLTGEKLRSVSVIVRYHSGAEQAQSFGDDGITAL